MLDKYIYRNLEKYGNALISESLYKKLGKSKILKILKEKGFNCNIKIIKLSYIDIFFNNQNDKDIIIEVIK